MKQRFLVLLIFISSLSYCGFAQSDDQQDKERVKFEKEMQQRQNEAISDFVTELEADAFVKEIISQKLHAYASAKMQIYKQNLRQVQREEKIERLNDTHFTELKSLTTPAVMIKIKDFITMTPDARKKQEKEKRKRKKKNKS